MNLREKILSCNDIETESVTVEQWGVELEVRAMTGKQRAAFLQSAIKTEGKAVRMDFSKMYAQIVIQCTFDPQTGQPVFSPADEEILNTKSGAAIEKISNVALRLSGIDVGTKDELEKNSGNIPNDNSISH